MVTARQATLYPWFLELGVALAAFMHAGPVGIPQVPYRPKKHQVEGERQKQRDEQPPPALVQAKDIL